MSFSANIRSQYNAERAELVALKQKAVDEDRSLTADEVAEVETRSANLDKLAADLEVANKDDERDARVAALSGSVNHLTTETRSAGVYSEDGDTSYFADLFRAQNRPANDPRTLDATSRLAENNRAMTTGSDTELNSVFLPPKYLLNELIDLPANELSVTNLIPSRTLLPSQYTVFKIPVVQDHATVSVQAAENDAPVETTIAIGPEKTISPFTVTGKITVSRQLLEAGGPALDSYIKADLRRAYAQMVEAGSVARLNALTGFNAVAATEANWYDKVLDGVAAVTTNRKANPNVVVMSPARWIAALKLKDGDGRPLVVPTPYVPVNVIGVGDVLSGGTIHGMPVVTVPTLADNVVFVARTSDWIHWSAPVRTFTFQEQLGPQSVVIAVWGYEAYFLGAYPNGTSKLTISA